MTNSFVADAHRGDGKRFVVRADEKLTAFLELESATRDCGELLDNAGEVFGEDSVAQRKSRMIK